MTEKLGKRYSTEIKESILKRMMPPNNEAISQICEDHEKEPLQLQYRF
jgi:transposase